MKQFFSDFMEKFNQYMIFLTATTYAHINAVSKQIINAENLWLNLILTGTCIFR